MPLPMPRLDNRTFDQLIAEGQALLPRLAPGWTDYNAHDPGITLMELFAWLAEMDFYRLDRTSDASTRAFLHLAGVEPRPAQVAETVLVFSPKQPATGPIHLVHLAPSVAVGNAGGRIVFQTKHHLDVWPVALSTILTGAEAAPVDRTNDNGLADKRFAPLGQFPRPGNALYLGFDGPLEGDRALVSLYVWAGPTEADREVRRRLIAECAAAQADFATCPPGTRHAQPNWRQHYSVRTVWEFFAAPGKWQPLAQVTDETRGLTLSGVVRFLAPAKDQHVNGWLTTAQGTTPYFIRCRFVSGRYDCPPEVQHIALNAVPAQNVQDVKTPADWATSRGWAGQRFSLGRTPVVPGSTRLQVTLNSSPEGVWSEAPNWDRSGPHARSYVLFAGSGEIEFGDGRAGRVLPAGAKVAAAFQVGSGLSGNVQAGSLIHPLAPQADVDVAQPFAASGGTDAETLDEAKGRAVARLNAPGRAVVLTDFEDLALSTPGVPVARAHAIADYDPVLPCLPALGCVTVVVVPSCPAARPEPGPDMLRAVACYLQRRRTLTTALHVIGPGYITIAVHARLHVEPAADTRTVLEQALSHLNTFLGPLRGGPDGTGWPIGRDVYRAEVMALLNGVPGVTYVDEAGLQVESEVVGCCGFASFMLRIHLKNTDVTVQADLHVRPNVTPGELAAQAQVELDGFFNSSQGGATHVPGRLGGDAQHADVRALLDALPGVTHVEEVCLNVGPSADVPCGDVSVCPHGLVASGRHALTVVQSVGHAKFSVERSCRS